MLDVTRLRVLVALARHGSVTAAAAALHYAQPSVSHHLARLEAETGTQLLQRAGRGVRLTAAGRLLAERAEEILGRLDAAEAELAEHAGLRAGRVRLAAFPSALGSFVPLAAARFAADFPAVTLTLVEAEPPEALSLLRSGEVDVAVVFDYPTATATGAAAVPVPAATDGATATGAAATGPATATTGAAATATAASGVRFMPLFAEPLHLVTPAAVDADLPSLAQARWIAGCDRCRSSLLQRCAAAGFEPDISFTTDDYVAVQALVAAGLGVTILPDLALRAHRSPAVRTVALTGGERHVSAAVYGAPPDPPGTARLLEALRLAPVGRGPR
ncbi:LysR family transcriptional regulator [Dactylosporangium sp. AC04546]|uniref:LysR family transcriptional regulator n=1 Tax=Dactylosporangium sp. AC04546 TaxID=2862460 RepID=UPI001EDD3B4E|nr:LysR family transcriptional regulator [Dactylosporangium sp. AC04546]WVK80368.1 LysR family transcriptional regulator [Dactylosporangium sp. AC04546]